MDYIKLCIIILFPVKYGTSGQISLQWTETEKPYGVLRSVIRKTFLNLLIIKHGLGTILSMFDSSIVRLCERWEYALYYWSKYEIVTTEEKNTLLIV